jgi:hypothetical protein
MQTQGTMADTQYQLLKGVLDGDTRVCEAAVAAGADLNHGYVRCKTTHPTLLDMTPNPAIPFRRACVYICMACVAALVRGHGGGTGPNQRARAARKCGGPLAE